MKKLVTVIVLALLGCEDPDVYPTADEITADYIEWSCVGDADYKYYVDRSCYRPKVLIDIFDAVDHVNDTFDLDIQICGYESNMPKERQVISCNQEPLVEGWNYAGRASWPQNDIVLWPRRMVNRGHLRKVVLHEFGHILMQRNSHSDNPDDIMCQGWHGATKFTDADIERIME